MNSAGYLVVTLFWLAYEPTVGDSDFFESSSHSENDGDPSRNFFSEERDSLQYRIDDLQFGRKDRSSKLYDTREDLQHKAYLIRFINILLGSTGFSVKTFL